MLMGPSLFFYGTSLNRTDVRGPVESSPLMRSLYEKRMRGSGDEFHNVRQHSFVAANYTKYFPHEERLTYDADTGEIYRATINGSGFRGPEIPPRKSPGTIRVVTLGASSTFGYHDPDDGTYPAILERTLNERCPSGRRYEVINLGIPHLTSAQIVSLFLAEAVPLQPDVVTFYEGINDSTPDEELGPDAVPKQKGAISNAKRWAREHFVSAFLLHEITTASKELYDAAQVEELARSRPPRFVENLDRLREECRARGIELVIGKQQARSLMVPREEIKGVTYGDEVVRVREKLEREGHVNRLELNFLIHDRVLRAEENWAKEKGVPVADIVSALDQDRDVLVSWVHLNPRGNAMVADTYAREILARTCRPEPATPEASSPPADSHRG
jgi:lysophospholipase L1-like esterase